MNKKDKWFNDVKRMRNAELKKLLVSFIVLAMCATGVVVSIVETMGSDEVLEGFRGLGTVSGIVGGMTFLVMQNFLAEFSIVESEYQSLLKDRN